MPFSNDTFTPQSGTYSGNTMWDQMATANEDVMSNRFDAAWTDLALALGMLILRNGANSPTANLPMNAKRHTGVQDAVDRSDYASYGQLLDSVGQFIPETGVGGTGNAITLAPTPAITAYTAGFTYRFIVQTTNTGAVNLAVSGLANVDFQSGPGVEFAAGQLPAGTLVLTVYRRHALPGDRRDPIWPIRAVQRRPACLARVSQAAYDALTPDANTLYLITS